jgi:hypothetical protein
MTRLTLLAFILIQTIFVQGQFDGWTNGKGKGVAALSAGFAYGLDFKAGTESINLQRNIITASLYGSYGLFEDLDIGIQVPFVNISSTSGLQDGEVFAKYMFLKAERLSLGVQVGGATPLSDYSPDNGIATIGQQAEVVSGTLIGQYAIQDNLFLGGAFQYRSTSDPVPDDIMVALWAARSIDNKFNQLTVEYRQADGGKDYRGTGDLMPSTFQEIGGSYARLTAKTYWQLKTRAGFAASAIFQVPLRNSDMSVGLYASYVLKLGAL